MKRNGCAECGARLFIADQHTGNETSEMTLLCSEGHVWVAQVFGFIDASAQFSRSARLEAEYRAERTAVVA
jgi:hypothetical protein